jgi:hypothetical protein
VTETVPESHIRVYLLHENRLRSALPMTSSIAARTLFRCSLSRNVGYDVGAERLHILRRVAANEQAFLEIPFQGVDAGDAQHRRVKQAVDYVESAISFPRSSAVLSTCFPPPQRPVRSTGRYLPGS